MPTLTNVFGYTLAIVAVMIVCAVVAILRPDQAILIVGLGGTISASLFGSLQQAAVAERQAAETAKVAAKVEESTNANNVTAASVANMETAGITRDEKLDRMTVLGEATHTLVNSKMGAQLLLNTIATRRLADLTKEPVDIQAADIASELYKDHQSKQAIVDSGNTTPIATPAESAALPTTSEVVAGKKESV